MKIIFLLLSLFFISCVSTYKLDISKNWSSEYHREFGLFYLKIQNNTDFTLISDRNKCFLNNYGDINGCTRMGTIPIKGKLKEISDEILIKTSRKSWDLEGTNYRIVYDYNLNKMKLIELSKDSFMPIYVINLYQEQ